MPESGGARKEVGMQRRLGIGPLRLSWPFVQAALAGYSDLPMRRLARRFGAPYALAEVVLDKLVLQRGKKQRALLRPVPPDDHPVGAQLMGARAEDFAPAAVALAAAGYDVIDMNFGCPVRKVLGRCRGGFLLSCPDTALAIVREVCAAVGGRCPVTVKMRRGMDDSAAGARDFFRILDGAFAAGVAAVTVHARTVKQRYVGPSDWAFLARVKGHAGERVIIGSGDLFSAEACVRMFAETGVDGVSIARGCIGNPWIFRDLLTLLRGEGLPPPPSIVEQRDVIAWHYQAACEVYGEAAACRGMRKFGIKYAELHPCFAEVRAAFVAVRTAADFGQVLQAWYDPQRPWPPVRRRSGPGGLIAAGARR